MKDSEMLLSAIKRMEDYFGKGLNDVQIDLYIAELSIFSGFQVKSAIQRICRERKPVGSQMPTPAEIAGSIGPYQPNRPTTTTDDLGPLVRAAKSLDKNGTFDTSELSPEDVKRVQDRHRYRFKMEPRTTKDGLTYFVLFRKPAKGGEWQQIHSGEAAVRRMKHPAKGDINFDIINQGGGK